MLFILWMESLEWNEKPKWQKKIINRQPSYNSISYYALSIYGILRVQKMINAVHFSTFMLCHPWEYKCWKLLFFFHSIFPFALFAITNPNNIIIWCIPHSSIIATFILPSPDWTLSDANCGLVDDLEVCPIIDCQ